MPELSIRVRTSAPVDRVWMVLKGIDSFPSFMEHVLEVAVVSHSPCDTRTSAWRVMLEGAVLEWTQLEKIDEDGHTIAFTQVTGDLSALSGVWSVEDDGDGGARIACDLSFEIGLPLLADVLNPVAVRALEENFQRMLDKIGGYSQQLL